MKKLILFVSLLMLGIGAMAQSNSTIQTIPFTADTLTNGDTAYMTSPAIHGLWTYAFQAAGDELTGTATLTGIIQFSNNNTDWSTSATADSLSLTADGSFIWGGTCPWKYVRVEVIQTGTATSAIDGTLVLKKPIVINQ